MLEWRRTPIDSRRLQTWSYPTRRSRWAMLARAGCWLACCALATEARAHELGMDELLLMVDAEHAVLRGQLTFNPHRSRSAQAGSPAELEQRVLSLVAESVQLEVDGALCATRFELRELWVPAGATLGDIVMLRCPLGSASRELRVFAAEAIGALVVSIQTLGPASEPHTRSALVAGGHWSPAYRLAEEAPGWIEGGAAIFERDGLEAGGAAGLHPARPDAHSTAATKAPRGALASALGIALRHFQHAVQRAPLLSLPLSFAVVFLIAAWAIRRIRG